MLCDAAPPLEKSVEGKPFQFVAPKTEPLSDMKVGALTMRVPNLPHNCIVIAQSTGTSAFPGNSLHTMQFLDGPAVRVVVAGRADTQLADDLYAIKNISGLTWERVSELTGKSRQAVHKWTIGGKISQRNRARISDLLAVMQHLDTGSEIENAARLDKVVNGEPVFNLIKLGKYAEVRRAFPRTKIKTLLSVADTPTPYVTLAEQLSAPAFESSQSIIGERTKPARKLAWRAK